MNKSTIQSLINQITAFRDEREWQALMDPKNTAIATILEAAELLEHFKWKNNDEVKNYMDKHKQEIEEEVMDVLFNALLMVHELNIDVDKAFTAKMEKNKMKYKVEDVKGRNPHV